MTPSQRSEFTEEGFVKLPRAFNVEESEAMLELVWSELESVHGTDRTDPTTWHIERPTHLQDIKRDEVFQPIGGVRTTSAIDDLLGVGAWDMPTQWGGFHIAFPTPGRQWDVPSGAWHVDFHYTHVVEPLFGLVVFSFFSDVQERVGATVAIAGSHKLVERFVAGKSQQELKRFAKTRKELASTEAWLHDLMDGSQHGDRIERFMGSGHTIDGVAVRVVELTTQAGDVILMHPWLLHSVSLNCRSTPRFMRAKAIYRRETPAEERS